MMNQEWFKDVLMITKIITKDDDKGDDKKLKGQSMNEFKIFKIESRTLQDSREKLISRIKNQDQDSRIKRRLNQDKYEKVFSKTE